MTPQFKRRLQDSKDPLSLHFCTIPGPAVPQAMAASGADGVVIDCEHGAIGWTQAHAMIAATAGTRCAPIVRIAETSDVLAKRALDMGAEGIVFPLIRTAEDARQAVASLQYPPKGTRGFGPMMASSRWGVDMLSYAKDIAPHMACILLVETAASVDNIDAICAVPGIDLLIPAPFDLSTDLGIQGQFDHPDFIAATGRIEAAAKAANIPLGGVATDEARVKALRARGFRVICGIDTVWLTDKTKQVQSWL